MRHVAWVLALGWGTCAVAQAPARDDVAAFLGDHFAPDVQVGDVSSWGPIEATLTPQACGTCHPTQHADWAGSRHARAVGPGVLAQILADPVGTDMCLDCHAPVAEQRPVRGAAIDGLMRAGLACVSCHARDGRVHGPPRRGGPGTAGDRAPHGGFQEQLAFEDPRFCGTCHQFGPDRLAIAGVPLENTLVEWSSSPAAAQGVTCQGCHMPDRRHLWRGIHDPAWTEGALGFELDRMGANAAVYIVRSERVGHAFPTYVTPRVTLHIEAIDAGDKVVARGETVIQRRVDVSLRHQEFDTRLAPGAAAQAAIRWDVGSDVALVRAWTEVEPDEFYARFFQAWQPPPGEPTALVGRVREDMAASRYVIGRRSMRLDGERHR